MRKKLAASLGGCSVALLLFGIWSEINRSQFLWTAGVLLLVALVVAPQDERTGQ